MAAVGMTVTVKRTFIECVDDSERPRSRTMSDTGFMLPLVPLKEGKVKDNDDSSTSPGDTSSDDESALSSSPQRVSSWADESEVEDRTTLMFRNLPSEFTRDMFTELLNREGFSGLYDFVYVPIDFRSAAGFGYAFVNMTSPHAALQFKSHFEGFARWCTESTKTAQITWSSPTQGLEAHLERYRSSPVMHDAVPDHFKPAMFRGNVRVAFPRPTKAIRMPRMRQGPKEA
jgi:hypothetical protein